MIHPAAETDRPLRPEISQLIERLSHDGKRWMDAEVAMARIEAGELKNRLVRVVIFAGLGFAAIFCALVALTQAGIAFLAPHVHSEGAAALIVAALLLAIVALSYVVIGKTMSWRTESIFFRWFTRQPPDSTGSP